MYLKKITGILLAALAAAPYLQTLGFPFLAWDDDRNVFANPWLLAGRWQRFWVEPYYGLYVPIPYTLWSWLHAQSAEPGPFHALNVLFHALNCTLVALVIQRLLSLSSKDANPRAICTAAVLGALVFGLHPLQCESVAWVSGLRDLSAAAFSLAATWLYLQGPRQRPAVYALALLSFSCGLLCKPSVVILPAALLLLDLLVVGKRLKPSLHLLAPWFAVAIPATAATRLIQGESLDPTQQAMSLAERAFVALDAVGFYLVKVVAPFHLAVDYGRIPERIWTQASWVYPGLGLALIGTLLIALVCGRRQVVLTAILLALVLAAPTLGLLPFAYQRVSTVSDRYMYLPMFAIALGLAAVLAPMRLKLLWPIAALVGLSLAFLTVQRVRAWQGDATFFHTMLDANPTSFSANTGLGNLALARGDGPGALLYYEAALAEQPLNTLALANTGLALDKLGRYQEVLTRIAPHVPDETQTQSSPLSAAGIARLLEVVGFAQVQTQQLQPGLASYRRAKALDPDNPALDANLKALSP